MGPTKANTTKVYPLVRALASMPFNDLSEAKQDALLGVLHHVAVKSPSYLAELKSKGMEGIGQEDIDTSYLAVNTIVRTPSAQKSAVAEKVSVILGQNSTVKNDIEVFKLIVMTAAESEKMGIIAAINKGLDCSDSTQAHGKFICFTNSLKNFSQEERGQIRAKIQEPMVAGAKAYFEKAPEGDFNSALDKACNALSTEIADAEKIKGPMLVD